MRQKYQSLEVVVVEFEEDVITTSTVQEDKSWSSNPWGKEEEL